MRRLYRLKDCYTIQEVAIHFGVNMETIKKWEKHGIIPFSDRDKNNWRIWKKEIIDGFELTWNTK